LSPRLLKLKTFSQVYFRLKSKSLQTNKRVCLRKSGGLFEIRGDCHSVIDKSKRSPKGQFKKGASGNSAGRPQGSRNKATLVCEQLLEGEAGELIRTLVEKAKGGNIQALGMCLDRLLPARKERCIDLELRPVTGPQDLPIQFQDITAGVAEGRITPGEGESLSSILTSHSQIMERVGMDQRIGELEDQLEEMARYRREMRTLAENRIREAAESEEE
jgi:hypothetical protein